MIYYGVKRFTSIYKAFTVSVIQNDIAEKSCIIGTPKEMINFSFVIIRNCKYKKVSIRISYMKGSKAPKKLSAVPQKAGIFTAHGPT